MALPQEQIVDAHQMTGDGVVWLYTITPVGGGAIYLKADNDVTWQGHTYEGTAIQISDLTQSTDGELSRPTVQLANPAGVYSALIAQGTLDDATVVQKRVLRQHIDSNTNIFSQRTWKVRRCPSLNRLLVVLELHDSLDGQKFLLPARMFMPPDFPSVSL